MALSLQDLLNPEVMVEIYREIASINAVPNELYTTLGAPLLVDKAGREFTMHTIDAVKKPAPTNQFGAQARTMPPLAQLSKKVFRPVHLFNEVTLDEESLAFLESYTQPVLQDKGIETLTEVFGEHGGRHLISRYVYQAKMITDGVVYIDRDGNILESSSGAHETHNYEVPAANKGTFADIWTANSVTGTSGLWSTAATKILTQLEELQDLTERNNDPPLRHVWMNSLDKRYFRENTQFEEWMKRHSVYVENWLAGGIGAMEINGFVFHFIGQTYEASDGSTKPIIPRGKAIFTPDPPAPGTGWIRAYNVNEVVATQCGVAEDLATIQSQKKTVYGSYAYCYLHHNPVKTSLYMGDNFLFGLARPSCVFQVTIA